MSQGSQGEQQNPQCFQTCMKKQFQEHQGRRSGDTSRRGRGSQTGRQQQQSNNPYVFQEEHFTVKLETEQGNIRFLQKFTDRSDLFQGIEKYRVAFLEAEPQTFVMPNHFDADALVYVQNGMIYILLFLAMTCDLIIYVHNLNHLEQERELLP